MLSSAAIRQALVPMAAGYLLIMTALGLGLLRVRRLGAAARQPFGQAAARRAPGRFRRGWPGLAWQVAGTCAGGYGLLVVVVIGYYYAVARVGGNFIESAFTGTAMLIGLALPVWGLASWLTERRRRRRARTPGQGPAGGP